MAIEILFKLKYTLKNHSKIIFLKKAFKTMQHHTNFKYENTEAY